MERPKEADEPSEKTAGAKETGGEVEGESVGGESVSSPAAEDWVLCAGAHSSNGYGVLEHVDELGMARVRLPWGVTCFTPKSDLQRSVEITITTFASLPRRPPESDENAEEKKEEPEEQDRLNRLYKMLEKSRIDSEPPASSSNQQASAEQPVAAKAADNADKGDGSVSPEEQKAMAAQDKSNNAAEPAKAKADAIGNDVANQPKADQKSESKAGAEPSKPAESVSVDPDQPDAVAPNADADKPDDKSAPAPELDQPELDQPVVVPDQPPLKDGESSKDALQDKLPKDDKTKEEKKTSEENGSTKESSIAAVAAKLDKNLESHIAAMHKLVNPSNIKQQISKLASPPKETPKEKPPPEMVRLKPCRKEFSVSQRVSDIVDALCKEYQEFGLLAEEVRLVNRGKELKKLDQTIAEAQILPPCRLLFVLQRKHSDYGGFMLMASNLQVSPDNLLVTNTGSFDKWRPIRCKEAVGGSGGVFSFEVKIVASTQTANSWRFCVGCVSANFRESADRCWVGSQPRSWAYIAGTGGKCNNAGQSTPYGEEYGEGDIIRMEMDFDRGTIEFFRNEISQGVAFTNLEGEVYPAVSLTGTLSAVQIVT